MAEPIVVHRKSMPAYEAKVYVGGRAGYDGPPFGETRLLAEIAAHAAALPADERCSVRVTETIYAFGGWREHGWEVAAIQYPRFPKPIHVIEAFALGLAERFVRELGQNRVSVALGRWPDGDRPHAETVVLMERADAEPAPAGVEGRPPVVPVAGPGAAP